MSESALIRIVDDRVLLLGIDKRYRDAMKLFESKVLLGCVATVASRLGVAEADVPLEGYYDDPYIPELPRYFRLMRALQNVADEDASAVRNMIELKRIQECH